MLGQKLICYTDHLNLTHKTFTAERTLRWRLLLEEYNPELRYIKGYKNEVADALSRLPQDESIIPEFPYTPYKLAEMFGNDLKQEPKFPLDLALIHSLQQQDKNLCDIVQKSDKYTIITFPEGDGLPDHSLICKDDKIVIPESLQNRIVDWYHTMLSHPGINRTEESIRQHFYWPRLREIVVAHLTVCDLCQRFKKQKKSDGRLLPKDTEAILWCILCVYLVGSHSISRKKGKPFILSAVTIVDSATSWFEVAEIPNKESSTIAKIVAKKLACTISIST